MYIVMVNRQSNSAVYCIILNFVFLIANLKNQKNRCKPASMRRSIKVHAENQYSKWYYVLRLGCFD
jgi:hypothetical protein